MSNGPSKHEDYDCVFTDTTPGMHASRLKELQVMDAFLRQMEIRDPSLDLSDPISVVQERLMELHAESIEPTDSHSITEDVWTFRDSQNQGGLQSSNKGGFFDRFRV
jgi:hypothetical protein